MTVTLRAIHLVNEGSYLVTRGHHSLEVDGISVEANTFVVSDPSSIIFIHTISPQITHYMNDQGDTMTKETFLSQKNDLASKGIEDEEWSGEYQLHGTRIWDSARRLEPGMYRPGQMQCLSFGFSKPMYLGKVGAILLDDEAAYYAMSAWRSDGRDLRISPWEEQKIIGMGYHYCPTLDDCQQGLQLLPMVVPQSQKIIYPDCRQIAIVH
jgi:hypothetical protein